MRVRWLVFGAFVVALAGCAERPLEAAEALYASGDSAGAIKAFKAIARRDPAHLAAWDRAVQIACRDKVDVGECLGVLDLELELLGKLDRHHDALAEVLERRARARIDEGLLDAALDDLARAENAAPGRAGVQVARALALVARGDRAGAVGALERAARIDPHAPGMAAVHARVAGLSADDAPFGGEAAAEGGGAPDADEPSSPR